MKDGRLRAIALAATAVLVLTQLAAVGAKRAVLRSRLGTVRQMIKQVRYRIRLKENEKRTVTGQLAIVEQRLYEAQDKLTANQTRLQGAQTDLTTTVRHLNLAKKQLSRRQALLKARVVDIYEGDHLSYLDVVLGSANMWTFLSRAYYLQQILHADTTLITHIRDLKASIEGDRARQAERVSQIRYLRVQLASDRDDVQSNARAKEQQIYAIGHDAKLMQQALDEMEAQEQAIEEEIRRIQSTPEGQRRLHTAFRGGFRFPVSGRLSSSFGYRHHPITGAYKLHTGIDLAVPTGTAVRAAADGVVIKSGVYTGYRAYGFMVVIEHNGGYSTLYGHNSRLCVSAGQHVKQGQVIARSGSTGTSSGPHVHYQLMKNGTPINPGRP